MHRTTEQSHAPGDGTAVIVETRLVTGEALSIIVSIDLDADGALTGAFAVQRIATCGHDAARRRAR